MHPAKTQTESSHYRHVCQAGEDDCAQIPRDRHPGRPDPIETPKNYPLNQRDMRKLLDLQMVTYTVNHSPFHTLPPHPAPSAHPVSPSKKQAERKSFLATASSQTIRCSASLCQEHQLTHYCIPSHFSIKTDWCIGFLMQNSRQDCSLPGAVTWRSAEPSHNQHNAIQQVQGLRGTKSHETKSRCPESGRSTCLLLLLKTRPGHLSIL